MELVGIVNDAHQRLVDARQHGIEAVKASGKSGSARSGIMVFRLVQSYYTIIPQIQASDPHFKKYDYGEKLAFTTGILEELGLL